MIKKILNSPFFYPAILVLICLFIACRNYTPGTYLTGWDTLHPEFNFPLNFSRLLSSVWRPEQGLGAVSGHSAMADLPRVFILRLFHFIFPLSFLRYSYIFLCLIVGPLGIYYLINNLHKNKLISFLTALFYLLNLGTVQQFYVPFEMFPTLWAYLPWIILSTLRYLHYPSRKFLLLVTCFWLLSTPSAYAAHLWYPFFGCYVLFLLLYGRKALRPSILLISVAILVNSFWLLPNLYYLATSSSIPQQNQQNRLHSQEFLLKNRETGHLPDVALTRGFYLNWDIYNFDTESFQKLMPQWLDHLDNYDVRLIGYLLFAITISGLIFAVVSKDRLILSLSNFFVIPFILLANQTPPFNYLFDLLLRLPLLSETLRFVFTKVSPLYVFGQTILIGYFLINVSKYIKIRQFWWLFCLGLIIYAYPIFQGYLISPQVRVNIPSDYFQLSNYLNPQSGRILTLPLHNPAGWTYNSWGYQGSGMIWWGLPQSVLDRDSDRWSSQNEEAYRELFTALYSADPAYFAKYLRKYKITHLLWDHSTISTAPKNQSQITFDYDIQLILDNLAQQNQISSPQQFGSLNLYSLNRPPSLVETGSNLPNITPGYRWHFFDIAYQNFDYQTDPLQPSIQFPWRNVLTTTNKIDTRLVDLPTPSIFYYPQDIITQNPPSLNRTFDTQSLSVSLYTRQDTSSISLNLENLPHSNNYIIGIKSQYLSGIPLRFCFKNILTELCNREEELSRHPTPEWDYFLVPSGDSNFGYQLNLSAIAYASHLSLSQIHQITIAILPPKSLISPVILPTTPTQSAEFKSYLNHSLFKINFPPNQNTLILNQSFNSGWLALYFNNHKINFLTNHILINNWANGWQLPITNYRLPITIYIFFWPQLLEYLGFSLLIGTFLWIIKKK